MTPTSSNNVDMLRQPCEKCKKGKYQEMSLYDDHEGNITCNKCGHRILRYVVNCYNNTLGKYMDKRVDWDTYFIAQCFLVSMRSLDPSTQHGAIIVDEYNRILSTGYNSPIRGIDDTKVPLTRPEKYPYLPHAEENAILSLGESMLPKGKIYITGRPCHKCVRMILQKGIRTIVYGPLNSTCVDEEDRIATENMISWTNASLVEYTTIDKLKTFIDDYRTRCFIFSV